MPAEIVPIRRPKAGLAYGRFLAAKTELMKALIDWLTEEPAPTTVLCELVSLSAAVNEIGYALADKAGHDA